MTEKRYYCDDKTEYRSYGIFDLSKADKTMDDFRDEDGICSWQFGNYLVDETDSMLTGDEVVDLLNEQDDRIETLKEDVEIILDYVLNKGKFAMTVKEQKAHNRLRSFVRGDVE